MRTPFSRQGGYEAGQRLLNRVHRPTAIFSGSDMQTVGLLRALHEHGVKVPQDIAIVSYDGTEESQFSWPALTVIHQPVDSVAEAAVRIATNESGTSTREWTPFRPELIIRDSCGCTRTGAE